MKIVLNIDDDCVDDIVIASLKRTIECVSDEKFADLFPDKAEITAACNVMIEYHSKPSADD